MMLALLVIVPLAAAVAAFLLGRRDAWVGAIGILTPAACLLLSVLVAWRVVHDGPSTLMLAGWAPPLGIALYADGLAALMLVLCAFVMTAAAVYALRHLEAGGQPSLWRQRDAFWPLWLFLLGSLNALFLSRDLFNLYVVLELLSLAGVALVAVAGTRRAVAAAIRYLLAVFLGSMLYLLGVAVVFAQHHSLDMHLIRDSVQASDASGVALVLLTVGLMLKSALLPFHSWLPRAHATAPSPVSAVLSGLVVMASAYLVIRLWGEVFFQAAAAASGLVVGVLGAVAILWGSIMALRQSRVKLILAYSTVAHVGYVFLFAPMILGVGGAHAAWSGSVLHLVSHGLAKAALFMCAGTMLFALKDDSVEALSGLARGLPVTSLTFAVAGVALIGLPPSGGFLAKWLLVSAAFESGQWWWAGVVAAGTLLGAAYVFRIIRWFFLEPTEKIEVRHVPVVVHVTTLITALLALTLGLWGAQVLAVLEVGAPFLQEQALAARGGDA
jgi:multicomponent Na+:H+ antiporter subunit D